MSFLNLDKLHVKFIGIATSEGPVYPRKYTLTHSDQTGDLFLSIGTEYDLDAISGWYTRLMRDEVLAEYQVDRNRHELQVFCHINGGLVFGSASWRNKIFQYHLPGVLEAFRYGDKTFIRANPVIDKTNIRIHFQSSKKRYNRIEDWGILRDYKINEVNYAS